MEEKATQRNWFDRRLTLCFTIVGSAVLFTIAACQADIALFLNVFVVAPFLLILSITCLIFLAVSRRRQLLLFVAGLAILWTVAVVLFLYNLKRPFALHETVKWVTLSPKYKDEVLEQLSANGDLKHIEWDGSGFAGAENNVYLVFDPSDSLSKAKKNKTLRFNGRSCDVREVNRLERDWYAVLFYTDQSWDECN
ncbi:MAG: hypothetical protein WBE20_07580 [Candidatus Acidiferrales bacterium]